MGIHVAGEIMDRHLPDDLRLQLEAELEALDIGHGYTADGGATFPFRGKAVGEMPTLGEALARA